MKEDNIKKMKYLDAVFKETLRAYSPSANLLFRKATRDHHLNNLLIEKDVLVTPLLLANQYSSKKYENPFSFNPERWIKEDGSMRNPEPFTWLAFSAGHRVCIGRQIAENEMKIIVIKMVK